MFRVRHLKANEVPQLSDFPPAEWKVDLPALFRTHFGQPYFHPFAAEWDGALVGCANGLVLGQAGWLGNIIVLTGWRGRGIGTALTRRVIDCLQQNSVQHQILVATSLGETVYRKLGFERVSDYVFFERKAASQPASNHPRIRRFGSADEQAVLALDHLATCEVRALFLHRFLDDAWVHVSSSGGVDGCHLPRLGNGLVIADNDIAGLALLQHKLSLGTQSIVVPDGNRAAVDCLLAEGFRETSRAPRMALGGDVDWQPRMVYSRGSGYCG